MTLSTELVFLKELGELIIPSTQLKMSHYQITIGNKLLSLFLNRIEVVRFPRLNQKHELSMEP